MSDIENQIIINGTNHIAGRLASVLAKSLLLGKQITVLGCESIHFNFPLTRAKKIYEAYLNKRCVVNPRKGPFHFVEPSKYFKRVVKRMLPHKKKLGEKALKRLKCYDGFPAEFWDLKKEIVPKASLKYKQNPIRKSVSFGQLLKDYGWKHFESVNNNAKEYAEYSKKKEEAVKVCEEEIKRVKESVEFRREVVARMERIE